MKMTTDIIYHDIFKKHELSPGHPEAPDRLESALDHIHRRGFLDDSSVNLVEPSKTYLSEIYKIHDQTYIEDLRAKSERGGGIFTLDTSSNQYTYEAAVLAASGGIQAVNRIESGVSKNAYVLCRPPGHHAEHARAYGFCFINNIAVTAQYIIDNLDYKRVAIIDYDAHHGNGTQNAFYSTNQVLYIGLHQDGRTLFPGSGFANELGDGIGTNHNINLAMYPGAGDESYKLAFENLIIPVFKSYEPDFVLVSVGFDCHFSDPLTILGLTTRGIAMINSYLNDISQELCEGKSIFFLEGGYNLDIVGQCSQLIIEELAEEKITDFNDEYTESERSIEYTKELVDVLNSQITKTF
jgi:acetoin utilization deacetylase AcuC-like enzyme